MAIRIAGSSPAESVSSTCWRSGSIGIFLSALLHSWRRRTFYRISRTNKQLNSDRYL